MLREIATNSGIWDFIKFKELISWGPVSQVANSTANF